MASYTTNLNLKKPAGSENVAIGDINNNMDAIDTAYGTMIPLTSPKAFSGGTQPTLTNGTHYSNGCYYWKFGCLLYLYVSVQFTSNPSNTTIFTLPSGYRPVSTSEITVSGGGSYNAKAQCQIGSDGVVKVTSVDKWVVGSGILLLK